MEENASEDFSSRESKAERKKAIVDVTAMLRDVLRRHKAGLPIIAEMAERILARERAAADTLIRDALGNSEKG